MSTFSVVAPRSPRRDRSPSPATTSRHRRAVGLALAVVVLVVAVGLSVAVGSRVVAPAELWHAFTAPDGSLTDQIVIDLRMPRTLAAVVVGVALGLAGALIQAFTRNPLGDPGILGVDAGAALFVALGVGLARRHRRSICPGPSRGRSSSPRWSTRSGRSAAGAPTRCASRWPGWRSAPCCWGSPTP